MKRYRAGLQHRVYVSSLHNSGTGLISYTQKAFSCRLSKREADAANTQTKQPLRPKVHLQMSQCHLSAHVPNTEGRAQSLHARAAPKNAPDPTVPLWATSTCKGNDSEATLSFLRQHSSELCF